MPSPLSDLVREWAAARNAAPDADVSVTDARHASLCGLPVLAALHELAARVEAARGPVSPGEVLSEIRAVIRLAAGEAERRAELAGTRVEIPGLVARPTTPLLEEKL